MKKGILIICLILWLFLIYVGQILAHILTTLSNTTNKQKIFNNPEILYTYPAKHPIKNIIEYISESNTIFIVIAVIVTCIVLYVILKSMFESKDGNEKNQDYKIAKHGSHGSARFATDQELFNGYYKKINENDVTEYVLKSLDTSKLSDGSEKQ